MAPETVRAAPRDAEGGPVRECMLGGLPPSHTAIPEPKQDSPYGLSLAEAIIAENEEFLLDEIYRDLDLIQSYTVSAKKAARRDDRDELRLRLRVQLRDCFRHAVELHNLLSTGRKTGAAEARKAAA
jgi:hypothetical protein